MSIRPTEINLHKQSRVLEIAFEDGAHFNLPAEYLRVNSPSAEVQGHGPGQGVLQLGKHEVGIRSVDPVGHYAVRLVFDDGHDSGLYTWEYLHELGMTHAEKWQQYLDRIAKLGLPYPTPVPTKRRL
jgi:DUF971 family protein